MIDFYISVAAFWFGTLAAIALADYWDPTQKRFKVNYLKTILPTYTVAYVLGLGAMFGAIASSEDPKLTTQITLTFLFLLFIGLNLLYVEPAVKKMKHEAEKRK